MGICCGKSKIEQKQDIQLKVPDRFQLQEENLNSDQHNEIPRVRQNVQSRLDNPQIQSDEEGEEGEIKFTNKILVKPKIDQDLALSPLKQQSSDNDKSPVRRRAKPILQVKAIKMIQDEALESNIKQQDIQSVK